MPTDTLKKVSDVCGMSMPSLENKWSKAKAIAAEQGQADNYGLIMSIFKGQLSDSCIEKLGWKKSESKAAALIETIVSNLGGVPCPACGYVQPQGTTVCASCGFKSKKKKK